MRKCVDEFYYWGRTRISLEVCKALRWRQSNGWPKDRACRDVLIKLAKKKLVRLPRRRKKRHRGTSIPKKKRRFVFQRVALSESVQLEFAKGNPAESKWNELVNRHHYLHHKVVVGRCIKYLVSYKGVVVGAICFSSASWRVECRDRILAMLGLTKRQVQNRVINNSRFLISPEVSIPNLASRALSLATRQVAHDWKEFYSIKPLVVETFVEVPRFTGACYKASNWLLLGKTRGFAKSGDSYFNGQLPKDVYVFGLNKKIRRELRCLAGTLVNE